VLRDRVSSDIYLFTSDLYARVTAGLIVSDQGSILVDTLPFPTESREMAAFSARIAPPGVRYVILSHYHADHAYGAYLFPDADLVAHARCRELLEKVGVPSLEEVRAEVPELAEVAIRMPDITFSEGEIALQVGGRVVRLIHAPGHTQGLIMAYVEDAKVLFASDNVMPVPSIVDGDIDVLRASLRTVLDLTVENMVQGHGEVILRGEVPDAVGRSLTYLDGIEARVAAAVEQGEPPEKLTSTSIEEFGLSRIPLNGLVQQIHEANVAALYERMGGRWRQGSLDLAL
jgi:glyoxylase-like metal-dependent hydrolase (beta-lactamase superfamily II)